MRINPALLKSVFFIGYLNHETNETIPVGTGVYLCNNDTTKAWIVTAAHVINELKKLGVIDVYLIFNITNEYLESIGKNSSLRKAYKTNINDWLIDSDNPTLDMSIYPKVFPSSIVDATAIKFENCIDDIKWKQYEIGLGDEVVITGFFKHHSGKDRNIPIVRIGNLAATNEEKIHTKLGLMDAYLIEARSIGGISGSPVYVNLGDVRILDGVEKKAIGKGVTTILLGIIHGHYDEQFEDEDNKKYEAINKGIAIVTPIHLILEAIERLNH